MHTRYDQYAKEYLADLLDEVAKVQLGYEVLTEARRVDVYVVLLDFVTEATKTLIDGFGGQLKDDWCEAIHFLPPHFKDDRKDVAKSWKLC